MQFPLTLSVEYKDGRIDFRVTYLFIKLFPFNIKQKKPRKTGKTKIKKRLKVRKTSKAQASTDNALPETQDNAPPETQASTDNEAPETQASDRIASPLPETESSSAPGKTTKTKRSLAEIIELSKSVKEKLSIIYGSSSKGLRRIMRRIIVDNVIVDITVRGRDAAKTAVNYGILSGVIYGIIAVLSSLTTVYVESFDVACDFDGIESEINAGFKVKISLSVLITSGLMIGTGLLRKRKGLFGKKEAAAEEENISTA